MIEFVALRVKTYAWLMYDDSEHKKTKGTKKWVIKSILIFENYKNCLLKDKNMLKTQHVFRRDHHNVHTVEIIKIALSSNDD